MTIHYDPDEYETVFDLDANIHTTRRKSIKDFLKTKAERLRQEEDEILAKAEVIKIKRKLEEIENGKKK